MKPRTATISVDIYSLDIFVQRGGLVNDCIKQYAKLIKVPAWQVEESDTRQGMFINCDPHKCSAIWLSDKASFGSVTHEVFHLAHHVLAKYGFTLTESSEEAYAYFIQYVTNEIMAKLFGWKLK